MTDTTFTLPCDGCGEQTDAPTDCTHGRSLCLECRYFNDCRDCRRERRSA